jgi:hypothetical protein
MVNSNKFRLSILFVQVKVELMSITLWTKSSLEFKLLFRKKIRNLKLNHIISNKTYGFL